MCASISIGKMAASENSSVVAQSRGNKNRARACAARIKQRHSAPPQRAQHGAKRASAWHLGANQQYPMRASLRGMRATMARNASRMARS